jgi:hypothetical protein
MRRLIQLRLVACAVGAMSSTPVFAGVADEVGLTDLINRLGAANTPTGVGVVVAQVEALEGASYGPNQAHPDLAGKTYVPQSGAPGNSGHATLVGQNYYGLQSFAPDINTIYLYEASHWATGGLLRTNPGAPGVPPLPTPGGIKCFNNSWIGSFGTQANDNDCLRRADFIVDRDELMVISGTNNGGPQSPLMAYTFNGISVGLANGAHTSGTVPAGYDGAGRMKPEIVAPNSATSFATPMIDAAAALLIETSNTNPGLSGNVNAKRSETLKATLLAGANHRPGWTNNPVTSGPSRGITLTPFDSVYGVDVVNIDRSHLILTGLEQNGATAVPPAVNIIRRGWDLVSIPSLQSRYWRFRVGGSGVTPADKISILATWHRTVSPTNMSSWTNANISLTLWRVNEKQQLETLVGDAGLPYFSGGNVISMSNSDNVEHLYINSLAQGDYVIELKRIDGFATQWDAAVAWLLPQAPGDITENGLVDVDDLLAVINGWGICPGGCPSVCPADLTGNCVVDVDDLLVVINNWG